MNQVARPNSRSATGSDRDLRGDSTSRVDKPFAYSGEDHPEYEDALVANRAGLERLRAHIDRAIQDGEAQIDDAGIEWLRVVRVEELPAPGTSAERSVPLAIGCAAAVVAIVCIFGLGVWKFFELLG